MFFFRLFINESLEKSLLIIGAVIIAGITGMAFVLLLIQAAFDIVGGKNYALYLFFLPVTAALFVTSKRVAQKNGIMLAEAALEKLQIRMVNDVRHAELSDAEKLNPSDIHIQLADAQMLSKAAVTLLEVSQSMLIILFFWLYISSISFLTMLIILCLTVTLIGCYEILQRLIKEELVPDLEKETKLIGFFNDMLFGLKEMKMDQKKNDDLFDNYIVPSVSLLEKSRVRIRFYMSEIIPLIQLIYFLTMGFIVFILSLYYDRETLFRMITIIFYTLMHANVIAVGIPEISHGTEILRKLDRMRMQKERESSECLYKPSREVIKDFQEITLNGIIYEYNRPDREADFSVGPVNLAIRKGELIFIVGGNGSGKSTLLKVLTGLYAPTAGGFQIDGKDIAMSKCRHLFSAVFGDFHLFDTLYGLDKIDEKYLSDLLERLELDHKTSYEDGRFTTTDLSTGQKKRLALIVALMENKPIYVLDEWAADQDPRFRQYFYETLLPSLKSERKTIIAVTHDERFFYMADRVIRMEYGQLREK
ncbi:ATP-binding cassette domain-containing protein [Desulfobacterales bacterium HSG2]|nr:ATP-binding cassette domain-containing protein [Desulfobacterales bacterium HSG2]